MDLGGGGGVKLHPIMMYLTVLFIWAFAATMALILILLKMGTEGRFFLSENFKRGGAVLGLINKGILTFRHVKVESGALVGNPKIWYFLPEMIRASLPKNPTKEQKDDYRAITDYNDIIKYRTILPGLKKPIWLASETTALASNPSLLENLEGQEMREIISQEVEKAVGKKKRKLTFRKGSKETSIILPISIDRLDEKVKVSFPPTMQKRAYHEGVQEGMGYVEKRNWKPIVITAGILVVFLAFLLIIFQTDILQQIGSLFTRVG